MANSSGNVIPASASTSRSNSRKGTFNRSPSAFPTVLFPAPRNPSRESTFRSAGAPSANSEAAVAPSATATASTFSTEMFARPDSRSDRNRSDNPADLDSSRSVSPRSCRSARTRSPSPSSSFDPSCTPALYFVSTRPAMQYVAGMALGHEPAAASERVPSFQTSPDQYRHWKLRFDGEVARLSMDVQEEEGLRKDYTLKLNSYDLGVDVELADAVQRIRFEHPEVRAVVITSLKDRIFCAGAEEAVLERGD